MTETERPHAELSSSKIATALKCAGSVVLARSLPQKEASKAMESGTKTHELSEIALEDYLQYKLTGSDPNIRAHLLSGDDEREERIKGYVDAVFNKALEGSITSKTYAIEDVVTIHEDFKIFGYADFWAAYRDARAKRAAIVVDLKDGRVIVDVTTDQLKFLACGLLEEFRRHNIELDYVRAAIYQHAAPEEERYKEVKYTAKQLDAFKDKVLKLAETIYIKKKYKFKAGKWCRYCKCQEICPTYLESHQNKTSLKLLDPSAIQFPEPAKIPDETLANIVLHQGALEDFLAACKKYALARQLGGQPIKGLKAIEGNTKRKIDVNKTEDIKTYFTMQGIDPFEPKLKGIGKLTTELKKKKLDPKIVDSFCTRGHAPVILVSESDPRPAIKLGADFLNDETEGNEANE